MVAANATERFGAQCCRPHRVSYGIILFGETSFRAITGVQCRLPRRKQGEFTTTNTLLKQCGHDPALLSRMRERSR